MISRGFGKLFKRRGEKEEKEGKGKNRRKRRGKERKKTKGRKKRYDGQKKGKGDAKLEESVDCSQTLREYIPEQLPKI